MKHLIGKEMFLSFIVVAMLISCDKKETSAPMLVPDKEEVSVFKFKFSDILESQKINGDEIISLAKEEMKNYFGKRIEFITPNEMRISGDSLLISKPHGIIEKYAIKWQKDELFLYRDSDKSWNYCGKLSGKRSRFLLNVGLFTRLSQKEQRTLYVSGQDYSLITRNAVQREADDTVFWLRMEVVLEK